MVRLKLPKRGFVSFWVTPVQVAKCVHILAFTRRGRYEAVAAQHHGVGAIVKLRAADVPRLLKVFEHFFEKWLFRARWLLAPAYLALAGVLFFLIITIGFEVVQLGRVVFTFDESRTVVQALTVVDVVLVMNLVLMVLFVGYTNFVSVFDFKEYVHLAQERERLAEANLPVDPEAREGDIPPWMSHLDYSGLKVQLMGSIIAIAAITILRAFLAMATGSTFEPQRMLWLCVVFLVFLAAALTSALINRLKHIDEASRRREGVHEGRIVGR
ncbi:MAG TPA: YqhA family protein [Phenylobacterium sp.]|nr:YqhA family protein [Phenylobacterium sp.]